MSRRTTALLAGLAVCVSITPFVASADESALTLPDGVDAVGLNVTEKNCTKAFGDYQVLGLDGQADDTIARRLASATPVLRFGDISDTHIIDDDGPDAANGTVTEVVLDPAIGNTSATFLNEEYTDEVLDGMIRTLNGCDLDLAVTTGDITDTNWLNIARRVIDNLNGEVADDTAFERTCGYTLHTDTEDPRLLDGSDCPIPTELLEIPTGRVIDDADQGMFQGDEGAGHRGPDVADDPIYAFNTTRALRQALDSAASAAVHGSSNIAAGLPSAVAEDNTALDIPFYAAFGNHDAVVKGTVSYQKPMFAPLAAFGRYFLQSKREFINEWLISDDEGFGFGHVDTDRLNDPDDQNDGYYAFDAALGNGGAARFIILDTTWSGVDGDLHGHGADATAGKTGGLIDGGEVTNPTGLEAGYMSQQQYDWLSDELDAADTAGQPVFVFSHHPDRTFIEQQYSEDLSRVEVTAVEVDTLLGSHDNVLAWIAGHTHANRVNPCSTTGCAVGGDDVSVDHGFWRFETASLIDWPQEGRVVEVFDLADLDADGEVDAQPLGSGYALRLTMISPDQDAHDGIVGQARTLSGYEAMCTTAAMAGGSASSTNARPDTFAAALVAGDFCPATHAVAVDDAAPAGSAADRDVILLP